MPPELLNVFVSYRRSDRPGHAGRVSDALRRTLGPDHVFYDVAAIRGGVDFAVAIKQAIEKADVVAVVIGPDWGRRRMIDRLLSRPDWTHFEISYARQTRKRILPLLVSGAEMPRTLPSGLGFLSTIHAVSLRDESWDSDVEDLLAHIPAFAATAMPPESPAAVEPARNLGRPVALASVVAIAASALWLGPGMWQQVPDPPQDTSGASPSGPAAPNQPPTRGRIAVDVPGATSLNTNRVGLMSATKFVLTAEGITDPDGDALQYRWDYGDGTSVTTAEPRAEKVYDRVSQFEVRLFVSDGRLPAEMLAAETDVTVRDVTGTWDLSLSYDPEAKHKYRIPARFTVTLVQQGNQLSGRILPVGSGQPTVLTGQVRHPVTVTFGSEHAWWNDESDAYFDLHVTDGSIFVQMMNRTPKRCGPQIPCLGAVANRQ